MICINLDSCKFGLQKLEKFAQHKRGRKAMAFKTSALPKKIRQQINIDLSWNKEANLRFYDKKYT